MDKAALIEILKAKGLDIAEEALKDVVEALFEVGEAALKASKRSYAPLALGMLPIVKPFVLDAIDKIDGQEN